MITRQKKIARNAAIVWVISLLFLLIASIPDHPFDKKTIQDIQQIALLAQGIALLWASVAYAMAKGYHPAVGGLILLFPIGLIILLLLEDKIENQELTVDAEPETLQQSRNAPQNGLNKNQKITLFFTALLAVIALMFPPFVIHHPQSGAIYNNGYAFLLSQSSAVVNTGLLALELTVIAIVGTIGVFLTKNN